MNELRCYDVVPSLSFPSLDLARGDFDRCRSTRRVDLVTGGDEALEGGGEVASLGSEASNDARALHGALANRRSQVSAIAAQMPDLPESICRHCSLFFFLFLCRRCSCSTRSTRILTTFCKASWTQVLAGIRASRASAKHGAWAK